MVLERIQGDNVRLYVHLRGQMELLVSGQTVWDREEIASSSEPRLLDYYKESGMKDLDPLLEKTGKNLAYDFIYLKGGNAK